MKIKKLCIAILLGTFFISSNADAGCRMYDYTFGDSFQNVAAKFNIDSIYKAKTDFVEIPVRGKTFCDDVPERTMIKLVFKDNKFIRVEMISRGSGNALMAYAESLFGTIPTKPSPSDPSQNFEYSWVGKSGGTNLTIPFYAHKNGDEFFEITSATHQSYLKSGREDSEEAKTLELQQMQSTPGSEGGKTGTKTLQGSGSTTF